MRLPNIRLPTPPMPPTVPVPLPDTATSDDPGNSPVHADYNLQPLAVGNLDHYIERDDEVERFHVI